MTAKQIEGKRQKVISAEIRFEFTIPDGVPQEKVSMYTWEKLKRICRGLSKNGLKVTPVVPSEFQDT